AATRPAYAAGPRAHGRDRSSHVALGADPSPFPAVHSADNPENPPPGRVLGTCQTVMPCGGAPCRSQGSRKAMRVGSFVLAAQFPGQGEGEPLRRAVRSAEVAEEAGLDSVWLAEHHFVPYGTCPSAVTLAALLLGRTR